MTEKRVAVGATGRTVAERVRHLREKQNLTYAELARRLRATGRTIPVLGLSRIETLERRVDSDDLVALAVALGVAPTTLLTPATAAQDEVVDTSASAEPVTAERYWRWMRTDYPLAGDPVSNTDNLDFQWLSKPSWQLPVVNIDVESTSPDELQAIVDQMKARPRGNN